MRHFFQSGVCILSDPYLEVVCTILPHLRLVKLASPRAYSRTIQSPVVLRLALWARPSRLSRWTLGDLFSSFQAVHEVFFQSGVCILADPYLEVVCTISPHLRLVKLASPRTYSRTIQSPNRSQTSSFGKALKLDPRGP